MYRLCFILCGAIALAPASPGVAAPTPSAVSPPVVAPAPPPPQKPAGNATRIPEPDTVAIFLLGAAGLLLGRRLSRSRRTPDA